MYILQFILSLCSINCPYKYRLVSSYVGNGKSLANGGTVSFPLHGFFMPCYGKKNRPLLTCNVAHSLYLDFKHVHIQHYTPHQVKYKHWSILEILQNVLLLPKELSSKNLQNQGERCV
jgi:hypothetical protein